VSDGDVARDIRRDVEAAGGSRWVPVRSVRDAFGRTTLTRKARGEIAEALAAVGVLADPPFDVVALTDSVRLFLVETAPPPRYEPGAATPPSPPPRQPGVWDRFRAWPAWAQWTAVGLAFLLLIGVLGESGGGGGDGGGGAEQSAQQAPDRGEEDDAEARADARERKRARARQKRERARERAQARKRERIRERRRQRARERRQRERQEARERREREAETSPEEEPADSGGDGCDPNYSGCVPEYPPDVNCPEVDGPVEVTGDDPHGLDRDGDKVACE
jgi:hypothetical protein